MEKSTWTVELAVERSVTAGKKQALIVGIDEYERGDIVPLRFASADAIALAAALRDHCGFDTTYVLAGVREGSAGHAYRSHITDKLEFLIEDLSENDLFVLAFFMHGVLVETAGQRRQGFLTYDSRVRRSGSYLMADDLYDQLEDLRAKQQVIFLDTCRDNPEAGRGVGAHRLEEDPSRSLGLREKAKSRGVVRATMKACKVNERAYESHRHGHGIFTHHLLKGIRGEGWRDGVLFVESLGQYVENAVTSHPANRQTPEYSKEGPGDIELARRAGDFQPVFNATIMGDAPADEPMPDERQAEAPLVDEDNPPGAAQAAAADFQQAEIEATGWKPAEVAGSAKAEDEDHYDYDYDKMKLVDRSANALTLTHAIAQSMDRSGLAEAWKGDAKEEEVDANTAEAPALSKSSLESKVGGVASNAGEKSNKGISPSLSPSSHSTVVVEKRTRVVPPTSPGAFNDPSGTAPPQHPTQPTNVPQKRQPSRAPPLTKLRSDELDGAEAEARQRVLYEDGSKAGEALEHQADDERRAEKNSRGTVGGKALVPHAAHKPEGADPFSRYKDERKANEAGSFEMAGDGYKLGANSQPVDFYSEPGAEEAYAKDAALAAATAKSTGHLSGLPSFAVVDAYANILARASGTWGTADVAHRIVTEGATSAVFTPDDGHIVTTSLSAPPMVWTRTDFHCLGALESDESSIQSISFSQLGRSYVTISASGVARAYDAVSGARLAVIGKGRQGFVRSAGVSPKDQLVVTGSGLGKGPLRGIVQFWDLASGDWSLEHTGHRARVNSVAFSPDGTLVVSASDDGTARIWSVDRPRARRIVLGHLSRVNSAVFSPDGLSVVTASDDNTSYVWDLANGLKRSELASLDKDVNCVAFSSDGKLVATASNDATIRLFDTATRMQITALIGRAFAFKSVAFSHDGRSIIAVGSLGTVEIWDCVGRI